MKKEIQNNGPIENTFKVYGDFYNYRSGIYTHVSGLYYGLHAVKVIGWGNSNGVDYWIAQNSWGTRWGENGFFRIKMGEVDFDKSMWTCTPDIYA
jgi:cathepsin B